MTPARKPAAPFSTVPRAPSGAASDALPTWRVNVRRVGYLVMGGRTRSDPVARAALRRPVGAEARNRSRHARRHVPTGTARPAVPPADAAHPAVRSDLE